VGGKKKKKRKIRESYIELIRDVGTGGKEKTDALKISFKNTV